MQLPASLLTRLRQRLQQPLPVLVILKDGLSPVAPIHHMIDCPRILNAHLPSHAPTLMQLSLRGQQNHTISLTDPFTALHTPGQKCEQRGPPRPDTTNGSHREQPPLAAPPRNFPAARSRVVIRLAKSTKAKPDANTRTLRPHKCLVVSSLAPALRPGCPRSTGANAVPPRQGFAVPCRSQ